MTLRGTINGSFSGTSTSNVKPVIEWSATQNISNNTSTVTAHLVFIKNNSYWYPYNLNGHQVTMSIDGKSASGNRTYDLRNRSREVIWTRTVVVNHNSDGSKKLNISASGNTGTMGSYSFNGGADLTSIPRGSTMSISPTSANFGDSVKFNISRASGSFSHVINYNINGVGGSAVSKTTSTTPTWSIPTSLMKHCTNGTSAKVTLWLDTYNGNNKVGNKQYTMTINVPSNVKPKISSLTISELNEKISSFGLANENFLQGNSRIEIKSSSSSEHGASIVKTNIQIPGIYNTNSNSGVLNLSTIADKYGVQEVKVTVTDSRGRTASTSKEITIHEYTPPQIKSFNVSRKDTYVNITKECTYSQVGSNYIEYVLEINGVETGDITHYKDTYTLYGYDIDKSYEFVLTINDQLSSSSGIATVGTGKQLLHIDKDHGLGVGKYRERGVLDIGGDTYITGKMDVSGSIDLNGRMSSTSIDVEDIDVSGRIKLPARALATRGGGLNAMDSDFVGLNGIYFNDECNTHGEGLMFPREGVFTNDDGIVYDNRYPNWDNLRVLNGSLYLNGRTIGVEDVTEPLWEGGMYMTVNHKITPTKSIDQCPNGWALVWVRWANGADSGYGYSWTYIHKKHKWGGGIYVPIAIGDDNYRTKYMYVRNNGTTLEGSDPNDQNGRNSVVLKGVYAW